MTIDQLESGYRGMVFSLYDPARFADRVIGELDRLNDAKGNVSNYRLPFILAAFLWVLLWYVCDPNRAKLLRVFRRVVPAVLRRYPRQGDAALQRLVIYRHVCRFVSMLERQHESGSAQRVAVPVAATEASGTS
jgi:Flp pilus assembly protein TadB